MTETINEELMEKLKSQEPIKEKFEDFIGKKFYRPSVFSAINGWNNENRYRHVYRFIYRNEPRANNASDDCLYDLEGKKRAFIRFDFVEKGKKYDGHIIDVIGDWRLESRYGNSQILSLTLINPVIVTDRGLAITDQQLEILKRKKAVRNVLPVGQILENATKQGRPPSIGVIAGKTSQVLEDFFDTGLGIKADEIDSRDISLEILRVSMSDPSSIAECIRRYGTEKDILIILRGGGTQEIIGIENSYEVISAVLDSKAAVVAALGHTGDSGLLSQEYADFSYATPTDCGNKLKADIDRYLERRNAATAAKNETPRSNKFFWIIIVILIVGLMLHNLLNS